MAVPVVWVVAAVTPPDDQVQPGWLGFFVVLGLGVVTYLLWRSMNTHLKRVNFESRPADEEGHQEERHQADVGTTAPSDSHHTDVSGTSAGSDPHHTDVSGTSAGSDPDDAAAQDGDELPDPTKRRDT